MGILTRQQGDVYVISSDRLSTELSTRKAAARLSENYAVWTGTAWSDHHNEAIGFASLADADEYVRANFAKITA
jgi:hypothetical protein